MQNHHSQILISAGLQQVFLGNHAVLWSLFSLQVGEGGFGKQVLKNTAEWEWPTVCVRSHCSHVGVSHIQPYSFLAGAICFNTA